MPKKPLVTVLITNYNKEKYIFETIQSIKNQTYNKIQIIVIDNLSTDGSEKIVNKFKNVLKLNNNLKKTPALNQIRSIEIGLKKSKGDIIFLLDGDDFFKKEKIENIVNLFSNNPKLQVICDTPIIFTKKKREIFINNKKRLSNRYIWPTTFPTSSISLKKRYFTKTINLIKKNSFQFLEIDFRLCCLFPLLKDRLKIIEKNFTFYRQVDDGIMSGYPKFRKKWWVKRNQAFEFFEKINISFGKKINYGADFLLTKIIYFLIK